MTPLAAMTLLAAPPRVQCSALVTFPVAWVVAAALRTRLAVSAAARPHVSTAIRGTEGAVMAMVEDGGAGAEASWRVDARSREREMLSRRVLAEERGRARGRRQRARAAAAVTSESSV